MPTVQNRAAGAQTQAVCAQASHALAAAVKSRFGLDRQPMLD